MNYEDYFTDEDVATFRRVKKGTMNLATVAREAVAEMVGGTVLPDGKEFVRTRLGLYRLAMARNSDNSTERGAHDAAGVVTVVMGDDEEMREFFARHGVVNGLSTLTRKIRSRLS
jgi:hypothetical protein